jgi:aspartate racemase
MKKFGIVGGLGWPSTVDYCSEFCRLSELWRLEWQFSAEQSTLKMSPEMSIESLDLNKAVAWLGTDGDESSWTQFDDYHRAALERLEASGAEFAVIASNTPHHRLESIVRGIGIPVIDIFDTVAKESARIGAGSVLILGTALTMRSPVLVERFAQHGVAAAGPRCESVRAVTAALIHDLESGKLSDGRERIGRIAKLSLEESNCDRPVVCLACTELPLAFAEHKSLRAFEYDGIVYLNSTAIHINAAFDFAVGRGPVLF